MSKTIFITGASGALGAVVVKAAAAAGHKVIACGRRAEPGSLPTSVRYYSADLSDEAMSVSLLHQILRENGQIDAAFLLTGGFAIGELASTDSAAIDQQMTTNLKTVYHVVRPLFAHMRERKSGQICLIGAKAGLEPASGGFALGYTLAKVALHALAKVLEAEGKPYGLRTSLIVPSIIDTPDNRAAMPKADHSDWVSAEAIAEALLLMLEEKTSNWRENVLKLYHKA